MKNLISVLIILFSISASAKDIPAYFKSNKTLGSIADATSIIKSDIKTAGYTILGEYSPSGKNSNSVIVFTNNEIKLFSENFKDRGALGAALKISLTEKNGKTTVSMINPYYMFKAYWGKKASEAQVAKMKELSNKALKVIGSDLTEFGGAIDEDDIAEYHYKMMMPYFTDPVELADYSSFSEGVKKIDSNLKLGKGNTKLVYKLEFPNKDIVVYGVALTGEKGESNFLSKIGEENIAALPYEIILQGKEATMLHGKYRLALYWPTLTMGQFMKIMSTPGDIEDALEAVCE